MKTTNTAANIWTFAPTSATVNGRTFPASYSLARNGDVYVFTALRSADGTDMPVRIHVTAAMPMHADAVAAAQAAKDAAPVAVAKADPAPAAQAATPAPVQDKPAPVQDAPKPTKARKATVPVAVAKADPAPAAQAAAHAPVQDKPAPVQDAPKPTKARKATVPVAVAKADPAPAAQAAAHAPVQDKPAPAIAKPWIGTTITGRGWNIAFDEQAQRTRVLFQVQPTDAQKAAIEKAGFFWSNQLQSWNKKLTCKAYRAAQELATALNALA